MATNKQVVRKNGVPVKRFWQHKLKPADRETWITTYPVYFTASNAPVAEDNNKVWSLVDDKAPRTLEDALNKAHLLVEDSGSPQTMAMIYEMKCLYRVGTEFDYKLHEEEKRAARGPAMFIRIATTTSNVEKP